MTARRLFTDAEMVEAIKSGAGIHELTDRFLCEYYTVHYIAGKYGCSVVRKAPVLTDERVERIRQGIQAGRSAAAIARDVRVSKATVLRCARRLREGGNDRET